MGVAEGSFFEQDTANNNLPVLKETITIDGTVYNCDESETDCWNAMKPYFENSTEGQLEMTQVCETLENQNRVNQQLEQSTVRIRLCTELQEGNTVTECTELETMIQQQQDLYPELACSAYGFGMGNSTDCEESDPVDEETPEETPTMTPANDTVPEGGGTSAAPVSLFLPTSRHCILGWFTMSWMWRMMVM